MPAYGLSGPRKSAPAVGITMEMASGMASLIGYRDGRPTGTGPNYMDPIGGLNATAAILTALAYRQRTGDGQFVEVPQVEAAMQFIGEELLNAAARGENPVRDGNHVRYDAPHDVFPALGDDQWIAIAVADDAAWRALCAIAAPALRDDPSFATLAQRLAHQDELFEPIASWTRRYSKVDAADLLQGAGVAAAPVLDAKDVAQAPYYRDRQFFSRLEHREAGCHDYHTVPIRLSRTPGGDRRAAPCLGQDTETILSEILGLTQDQIEALAADGVISALPT